MSTNSAVTIVPVSRLGWCVLALVLLAPWTIVVLLVLRSPQPSAASRPSASASKTGAARAETTPVAAVVGPWGRLSTARILIEPPEDLIPAAYTAPRPLRWVFTGYTTETLDALWRDAGLTEPQRTALNRSAENTPNAPALVLHPPAEILLGLSAAARAKIYAVLAQFPENSPQRDPFRTRAELVDDWFGDDNLPPAIVALTRQLLYPRNDNLLFSDQDLVLPRLGSARERLRYIKALSRKSALMVQLHLAHGDDVDAIARYWTRGRRSKDVHPLLESLAQRPDGGSVDIVHLLPPFPRLLLYTYPTPSDSPSAAARDCHWTSLNFFKPTPDERFTQLEFVEHTLLNDYYPVGGAPELGDIIVLMQGTQGIHSCVYVADDIVFTKNGASFAVPWTLARLENVLALYSVFGPVDIRRYRSKNL